MSRFFVNNLAQGEMCARRQMKSSFHEGEIALRAMKSDFVG